MSTESTETLFEGLEPRSADDADDAPVPEPVEIDDLSEVPDGPWEGNKQTSTETAVEWLFRPSARLGMIAFALEELESGDALYRNKSELANEVGSHRATLHRHLDRLLDLGIYEETSGMSYDKYRANADSDILQALAHLEEQVRQRVQR